LIVEIGVVDGVSNGKTVSCGNLLPASILSSISVISVAFHQSGSSYDGWSYHQLPINYLDEGQYLNATMQSAPRDSRNITYLSMSTYFPNSRRGILEPNTPIPMAVM
jgi:hypothetical protein